MFEGLKSALGLASPQVGTTGVDAVTHQMLRDLNLPDPDQSDAAPIPNRRDPLEEARESVADWSDEGRDVEQELDIVFEALFDTEAQAQAYLFAAKGAGFDDASATATRQFEELIAATIMVSMIPAPEDIAKVEMLLTPLARQAGGLFDGFYLDGQADVN